MLHFGAMAPTSGRPLFIASDHAGIDLKSAIQAAIPGPWVDLGPTTRESVDYPDFASALCKKLASVDSPAAPALGVLICGSGAGMCIAANRHPEIRAVLATNPAAARLAREHNHANVLCLGARFTAEPYAAEIVRAWLEAKPTHEARHLARIQKLQGGDSQ